MRTTLTRSAVAIATLAIGSAALAAVPANAATPSGITRDMVLTATNGARASGGSGPFGYSEETYVAARAILTKGCAIDFVGGEDLDFPIVLPTDAGGSADGALVFATIYNNDTETSRTCALGVVATTDSSFSLAGTASLTGTTPNDQVNRAAVETLSGDVFATAPLNNTTSKGFPSLSFTTSGNATRSVAVSSRSKVPDIKTEAQKDAARATYDQRIASAKKAYAKALAKADTKAEKSAAKKAYKARRALAKAKYQYAVSSFKILTKATTRADNRPFSLSAGFDNTLG